MAIRMTRITLDIHSDAMDLNTQVTVLLPDVTPDDKGFAVLYLLHGKGGDHTDWTRLGAVEHHVRQRYPLCVVMPAVQHSFYRDMVYGLPYYQYLAYELPKKLKEILPISTRREDTFIAGRSMGGYGAIMMALNQPHRFSYAASISGSLDLYQMIGKQEWPEWKYIFGEDSQYIHSNGDLVHMLGQVKANKPQLFACCGSDDGLLSQNEVFVKKAKDEGFSVTFFGGKGGHDWNYGNEMTLKMLDWLPLEQFK